MILQNHILIPYHFSLDFFYPILNSLLTLIKAKLLSNSGNIYKIKWSIWIFRAVFSE